MAYIDTDTAIHIYQSVENNLIGQRSSYTDEVHPGTNKKIEGWKWNERTWPTEGEFRATAYAPSIWDPSTSGIDEDYWQSGYGDNEDLALINIEEVITADGDIWAPKVHHGYFYTRDKEWYLYSDAYLTEHFSVSGVESGKQVLTLNQSYKPTIPIHVRSYKFNRETARHEVYRDFKKKIEFSDEPDGPEFTVDTTTNPPKLILDQTYTEVAGTEITLTSSGTADPNEIYGLDILGISDGSDDQEFRLEYSPIDRDSVVQLWTWTSATYPTQWTSIDPLDDFTLGTREAKLDYDNGTLLFSSIASGIVPPAGHQIGAYYTIGISALYEPINSIDDILAYNIDADTNPVTAGTNRGFVQVGTESIYPEAISLSADLTQILNNYILSLGNNVADIIAEVQGVNDSLLEGQEVTFEILDPQVGTFGTLSQEVTAVTGPVGLATVLYNSPQTIQGLGSATINVEHGTGADSGKTFVTAEGVTEPSAFENLYIYKVHTEDDVLGIPSSGLDTYYTDYLNDEGIEIAPQGSIEYEQNYRSVHDLGTPTTYESTDYTIGKKTIILTTRSDTMNPHTGAVEVGILVPLIPIAIVNTGTTTAPILRLTYDTILSLPGTGDTRSYFIIGDATTRLRASVLNQRTQKRIYSNTITIEIQIPDLVNGTFFSNALNDIPDGLLTKAVDVDSIPDVSIEATSSIEECWDTYLDERLWYGIGVGHEIYLDWFRRTKRGDTVGLNILALDVPDPALEGLNQVIPIDAPSEIPLGFRLKSTGVTIASVLNQITYLDPNDHLPSGYWE
jgi:hypothetical protein